MRGAAYYAAGAAESLNELARFTADPDAYEAPCDVYEVLQDLLYATYALEQILAHASRWLREEHDDGRVGHDQSSDPATVADAVDAVSEDFYDAENLAAGLAHALDSARQVTSHLTGVP